VPVAAHARSASKPDMKARIDGLVPELERYSRTEWPTGTSPASPLAS
jgi:hypothetical protein